MALAGHRQLQAHDDNPDAFCSGARNFAMSAESSVVGDVEAGELFVFRLGGVTPTRNNIKLPQMDEFEIPARELG